MSSHKVGAWTHKHGLIIIIRSLKRSFLEISRSLQFKLHLYFAITKSQIFNSTLTTRFRVKGKNPSDGSTDRQVRIPIGPNWSEISKTLLVLVVISHFSDPVLDLWNYLHHGTWIPWWLETIIFFQVRLVCWKSFQDRYWKIKFLPQVGLEPTTFGLEVQRAIHCATGAVGRQVGKEKY